MRADREAGPAESSYHDITINNLFVVFQVEESELRGSRNDPFLCGVGRGIDSRRGQF